MICVFCHIFDTVVEPTGIFIYFVNFVCSSFYFFHLVELSASLLGELSSLFAVVKGTE